MAGHKRFLPYTPKRERNYRFVRDTGHVRSSSREVKYGRSRNLKKFYCETSSSSSSSSSNARRVSSDGEKFRGQEVNVYGDCTGTTGNILPPQRCNLVLSRCYNINRSGSKKIILGLDVENDFQTTVFIAKNGNAGVYFSQNVWDHLTTQLSDSIDTFFGSEFNTDMEKIQIDDDIKIDFMMMYGEKIIRLVKCDQYSVLLGRESWQGLLNLRKCVEDALAECNLWNDNINAVLTETANRIRQFITSNCKSCTNAYVSDNHDCSNLKFIEKYMNEYLEANTHNMHDFDVENGSDYRLPKDRLMYELQIYYPEILVQTLSK